MKKSIFTILLALFTISLTAGWEITYRISDSDGIINYDVMLIENHMVKYTNNDFDFLIDAERGLMTFILKNSNSYWFGKPDDFRAEMNNAMKKMMDDMMAQIPEAQRVMYAEMLGGMAEMYSSPSVEELSSLNIKIINTNEKVELAGYSAEKYSILIEDNLKKSVWISKNIDLEHDYDGRKVHEILSKIMPNVDNEDLYEFSDEYLNLMDQGLLLKSHGPEDENVEVIKIVERTIMKNELEIPEDYNEITIDELLQQQMMQSNGND